MKRKFYKWQPAQQEGYYYILMISDPVIIFGTNRNTKLDREVIKIQNCFRTKAEAKIKLKQILILLKAQAQITEEELMELRGKPIKLKPIYHLLNKE